MKLKDLLDHVEVLEYTADLERDVESVAYDSRKVTVGALFVAISIRGLPPIWRLNISFIVTSS
jgi:UDP-N-acetylmuramyl pentapeptide synthase